MTTRATRKTNLDAKMLAEFEKRRDIGWTAWWLDLPVSRVNEALKDTKKEKAK